MGKYLNSPMTYMACEEMIRNPYFVDKSKGLEEILTVGTHYNQYLCITRPRRFGKTVMANMLAAFLSTGLDGKKLFDPLMIGGSPICSQYQNQCQTICISFNEMPRRCTSYDQYISRIESQLIADLKKEYPQIPLDEQNAVWDIFTDICLETGSKFVFILDEWDYIFHQDFVSDGDKASYLSFLRNLLKDKSYVLLAYMTGILPISKYSSGSELNMFWEYTMINEERFSENFGFTEQEVDELYERYLTRTPSPRLTRESLRDWYDGYHTFGGERVYNPRSVVAALSNNNLGNYWTSSGPYDEIYYYIRNNIADVRNDLAMMVSGEKVPCRIQEYAATAMNLETREEIFSAMVVYGFLSYDSGKLSIPNRELMGQFETMLRKEKDLGYVYRLARESQRMLQATLAGDTQTMSEILEFAHNTETPLFNYNHETELSAIVNLVYLAARDDYRVEREDKAGIGYVDFIFYPLRDRTGDCIILELKVDSTPEKAIQQIRDRNYMLKFQEKMGETPRYTGRILLVGIGYNRKDKVHRCLVEIVQNPYSRTTMQR